MTETSSDFAGLVELGPSVPSQAVARCTNRRDYCYHFACPLPTFDPLSPCPPSATGVSTASASIPELSVF